MGRNEGGRIYLFSILTMLRIFFRIILFLFFFEIFLHLGGFFFLRLQDISNSSWESNTTGKENYTILCMGDSITAYGNENSYPKLLEKRLNESLPYKHFKVINKGVPSRTSANIISFLRMNIGQYKPDIVIVMMGAEDVEYADKGASSQKQKIKFILFEKLKIFRFIKELLDPLRPDLNKRMASDTQGLMLGDQEAPVMSKEAPSILKQSVKKEKLKINDPNAQKRYEQLLHISPLTAIYFNDFMEITSGMGKKLIITQYPLISIQPIKDIFKNQKNIVFVENKANFEEAIKKSSREDYFNDLITPIFGHCSPAGNELIAQNLATAVLSMINNKK